MRRSDQLAGGFDCARQPAASTRLREETPMPASSQPPATSGRTPVTGGPPWAVSEPVTPSGPPWAVNEPGNRGGPPWPASEPPPGGSPPWPVQPAPAPPGPGQPGPGQPGPGPVQPGPGQPGPGRPGGPPAQPAVRPQPGQPRPGAQRPDSRPADNPPAGYSGGSDGPPSTGSLPAITGGLTRRQGTFTGRITRDGSSGYPAEPGRYQLYASLACPWSQRALIVCRLLGLDRVIGLTLTDPVADERGWRFSDESGGDPLTGARLLSDLYQATDPNYQGPFSVPLIWDLKTRRIVSNDVAQITVMLETEFRPFHRQGAPDLYPASRRRDIESLATLIFHTVNTGVYKAGLAVSQAGYEQAVEAVFTTMDALEERLARRRFLLGDLLTEADIRLYPTLARFDAVYYQMFDCNLRRLTDYPQLWGYARDLYAHQGFGETTDLLQIKRHYFQSTEWGERSKFGIIPIGPELDWAEPHGRARLSS